MHADGEAQLDAALLAAGGDDGAVLAALGHLQLTEVVTVQHLERRALERPGLQRLQLLTQRTGHRLAGLLERLASGLNGALPVRGSRCGFFLAAEDRAPVLDGDAQRRGERGLQLERRGLRGRTRALQTDRPGLVEEL